MATAAIVPDSRIAPAACGAPDTAHPEAAHPFPTRARRVTPHRRKPDLRRSGKRGLSASFPSGRESLFTLPRRLYSFSTLSSDRMILREIPIETSWMIPMISSA